MQFIESGDHSTVSASVFVTNNIETHHHNSAVATVAIVFIAAITSPIWLPIGALAWLLRTAFSSDEPTYQVTSRSNLLEG